MKHDQHKEMATAYIAAALWTSDEDIARVENERSGEFEPSPKLISSVSVQARLEAHSDCLTFITAAGPLLEAWSPGQAGHDLWLTRNGHGTGFWDRDFADKATGEQLTKLAHGMGARELYAGDDGLLYFEKG